MTKDEALTLEALKYAASKGHGRIVREIKIAPFTIKGDEALAQPAQEPKSVTYKEVADTMNALRKGNFSQKAAAEEVGKLKLYTAPPQRPWVGLTIEDCYEFAKAQLSWDELLIAAETKLKEKNNAA